MFLLKKLIGPSLFPLSLTLILLVLGVSLLWFSRRQTTGKIFITVGSVLLLSVSYGWGFKSVLHDLEHQYPPITTSTQLQGVKWIVVLGGGTSADTSLPLYARLQQASLARLIEGVRLYKQIAGAKLVVSGGKVFNSGADAESMQALAIALGVTPTDIVQDAVSQDTETEALIIKQIVGNDWIALVTSASHMPRSVALFQQAGVTLIAAPTDYLVQEESGWSPRDFFPNADPDTVLQSERMVYEYLGIGWAKLRGLL